MYNDRCGRSIIIQLLLHDSFITLAESKLIPAMTSPQNLTLSMCGLIYLYTYMEHKEN